MKLLVLLAGMAAQETPVRAQTVENEPIAGTRITIALEGKVLVAAIQTAAGERRVSCDMLVEITLGPRPVEPAPTPERVRVELTSGDVLYGTIAEAGAEGTLKLATQHAGERAISFGHVRWLGRLAEKDRWPARPPKDAGKSYIYTSGEDLIQGPVLQSIGPKRVRYELDLGEGMVLKRRDKLTTVAAIYFMKFGKPLKVGNDLIAVLDLADGSRIRGRLTKLDAGGAVLVDLYKNTLTIPRAAVRTIAFRNGRVVYLSDLAPTAVDENANFIRVANPAPGDLELPHRADRNARGGALSLRGRVFRKGIGVHSYSSLTYPLGGNYKKFLVTIGIDDCAAGLGNVAFEVYVGARRIATEKLTGRDAPRDLSLDVAGAASLRIVVDFGGEGGVGDYADWAGARLLR